MKVKRLLKGKDSAIYCIHPDESLNNCIKILNRKSFGALLVLSQEEATVLGIISERDVLRTVEQSRGNLDGIMVKEVMTPRKYMVFADVESNVHDVLEKMNGHGVRHMPVMDYSSGEELVGLLAVGDVIRALLECATH